MVKRTAYVCFLAGALMLTPAVGVAQEAAAADVSVPAGGPLSEPEIIILLQAKVPLDTIQGFVAKRGVNFVSTKESSRRIIAAGGNVALIGTVNLNQRE
ncbi:MAG TPA: hypothetical protein VE621_06785, partial [Bryobacteraceae bacterium]|nr:hypothetical protein [Bryobacteraceae bacterium]